MAEALKGADGRYTLVGREKGSWTIGTSMAGRISVQIGDEGGANYYEGAALKDALVLMVPLSDPRLFRWNGLELDHTSLAAVGTAGSVSYHAKGVNRSSLLMLPIDMFGKTERFESADATALRDLNGVLTVDPRRIELLRRMIVHYAAIQTPLSPSAERAAEDEFVGRILSVVESRARSPNSRRGRPWVSRQQVLRKVRDLIEAAGDQIVCVEDLCSAAGVSERTLRTVFNETYGVGPIRCLRYRRLNQVRAALRVANPFHDTVAEIATEFGFWEFGRLAQEY